MEHRTPARLGRPLSAIGQGCWQLGIEWGDVPATDARSVLDAAVDAGVTFFDTADVYGDGRSEQFVGELLRRHAGDDERPLLAATKVARRADPFAPESFTEDALRGWVERSRQNLATDTLDLVQLHCPPPAIYHDDRVFDLLDTLVGEGKLAAWGVSVETSEEALIALEREHLASIQIVLNPFRLKPLEQVVPLAQERGVALIARVPLASGLLSGRYDAATTFAPDDHRTFNNRGQAFDRGETFSGVDFAAGLEAVARLQGELAGAMPIAEATLRWLVSRPGVTSVIPGARTPQQVRANAAAGTVLTPEQTQTIDRFDAAVRSTYDDLLRESVHPRW